MSIPDTQDVQNRQKAERRVAEADHLSKPDSENTVVVRDANGRWIFEVYLAGHTVSNAPSLGGKYL